MTENGSHQLIVKARFNFKQTNEDELSVCKGDIIYVTRVEEGGWWEGTLNGRTGWFPSNYVREIKSSAETRACYLVDGNKGLSDDLEQFMESQGASSPGILILTTSLSKPFMRLEKYVTLLQELERHMEDTHPDHQDVLKAIIAFKTLMGQCQDLRKRKQLELQILSEPIQAWEGESIKTLGNVLFMSQVMVQQGTCEEKEERYLLLFSSVLIMLSASPRMSGFIYQGKIPVAGMVVTRLDEIEGNDNAFEITGNVERTVIHCSSNQDLQEWLEQLCRLIRGPASCSSLSKTSSSSCSGHSSFSSTGQPRGPLEPPQIIKPWSLSCLRPAPPLRPSAALGYKERMSYILKESSKSPKTMKKFLHKRKTERKPSEEEYVIRKSTAALEEDAQILKVIEAYCTSANFQQGHGSSARKDSLPQVLLPEEEKLIIEETRSNGQTIIEEKSLVDTVYALKDEVKELKQENKRMKQCLEEELKSRRDLEKLVRRLLKQTDECIRAESSSKTSILP
ncbi:rho guanine nucleotide exchange factor 6 [Leptonychotes weddellii]|uniref:Rho guanine nucleotide exchange factor 6 n=1 Tax=Leptonychotes weddellii TaxID=9713 RepID=A0A2U3YMZ2_LEPWE|nr:rho guanine nucleotide exchange factor 6 [Leptonychotes weddellii]